MKPSDMIVFGNSDRPSSERSIIRKWADMVTFGHATPVLRSAENSMGIGHVAAALHSVRASGEALITGSLLGAASGAGMLDHDGVPMDLAGGIIATAIGVAAAHYEIGATLRTAGHTAIGIFGFRKTEEWLGVRKASIHGDAWSSPSIDTTGTALDDDPVIQAARSI